MTEKETEGLALLKHYAGDVDGRVILAGLAESIRVAHRFERKHWVLTVHGKKVRLRLGTTNAVILGRDGIEILLVPDILNDDDREELAAHKTQFKPTWGPRRYKLDWSEASQRWRSVEKAHHAVLEIKRSASGQENPEADALIDFLSRELGLDLPYPDRALVGPDGKAQNMPTVDDCLRLLTRRSVPNGQIQLYQALWAAGSKGATTAELVSTMGRRDAKDFNGVLLALGNRINHTLGYGETQKPGIEMILRIREADEAWRYHLKPVMREALEAHAPSWLPGTATSRWTHLVDLVRSRFPGWLGFEDLRFNEGPYDEVGYKLATVRKAEQQLSEPELRRLIDAEEYGEMIARLIEIGTHSNLLWNPKLQMGDLSLLYHDGLDQADYCRALLDLLYGGDDTPARLDRYVNWVSSKDLDSMNRWALPTYFLFFLDADNDIFVKPTATRNLLKLGGWDIRFDAKPNGDDYARIRDAYRELRDALADYGPRHMIDIQSFGWVAQEEADRQERARQKAEAEGSVLDPRVENAMKEFERTADAEKLIDQATRIEQAKRGLAETFGHATKLRSLSPEAFFDFFNEVDSHGGTKGIFSLGIPFSKDPDKPAFRQLQEDLPTLREALTELLHGGGTEAKKIDAMWEVGNEVKNYVTEGLTVASALLFIQDPEKTSGVLSMQKKEEKLRAAQHMPNVPQAATLGERFEAFEQALTELPERYGRKWTPEARKEFYFSDAFKSLENGPLPPPPPPSPPPTKPSFGDLVRSIEADGLFFPTETVANYVLALQTKRFAILTGISGTGKTRIAMAVARSFRATARDRRATDPDEVAVPEDATEVSVVPMNIKHGVIQLPVAFGSVLRLPPTSGKANRGRIRVSYPEGDTTLSFRQHPQPAYVRLHPAGRFGAWFRANLNPGDSYWIRVFDDEEGDYDRLEIRLPPAGLVKERIDNCEVVPVRPDWVDNRGLLGYLNPITGAYSATPFLSLLLEAKAEEARADKEERPPHPFLVVLDEMNLARVEHYFSDFLSALESGEPIPLHESKEVEEGGTESGSGAVVPRQLRVPENVFFTGTVNVDETTYMFSPKVLDRAFTIEFDQVDLKGYTDGEAPQESGGLDLGTGAALALTPYRNPKPSDWRDFCKLDGGYGEVLRQLHGVLEEEHRHFGYRVANEIARFVNLAHAQSSGDKATVRAAFDLALRQKVLPKFHGTQQELEPLLKRLFNFALDGKDGGSKKANVTLDDWRVSRGRLSWAGKQKPTPGGSVPAGTPPAAADEPADGGEGETKGSTTTADVDSAATEIDASKGTAASAGARSEGCEPEFPRTAAKLWRMLKRLEQRGFTSFIE